MPSMNEITPPLRPEPVSLPASAKLLTTLPSFKLGDNSISTGVSVSPTSSQLQDVARFSSGIGHLLNVLQLFTTIKTTDHSISFEKTEIPILMEYDSGNMWYLDLHEVNFEDLDNVKLSHPNCKVENIDRDKKRTKSETKFTDTVYKCQFKIDVPESHGIVMYGIRDAKNAQNRIQNDGEFTYEFTGLKIDLTLGITETPDGENNRYQSPEFQLDYEFKTFSINSIFVPNSAEDASIVFPEDTAERLLADLQQKIEKNRKEMADRLRAAVIENITPKLKKTKSKIELANLFAYYIYREMKLMKESPGDHLDDPQLTRFQYRLTKALIFALEDSPRLRNVIHRLLDVKIENRILIPFILNSDQEIESNTVWDLNQMRINENFDEKSPKAIGKFKELLSYEPGDVNNN